MVKAHTFSRARLRPAFIMMLWGAAWLGACTSFKSSTPPIALTSATLQSTPLPDWMTAATSDDLLDLPAAPKPLSENPDLAELLEWALARSPQIRQALLEWKLAEECATDDAVMPASHHIAGNNSAGQSQDQQDAEVFQRLQLHSTITDSEIAAARQRYDAAQAKLRHNIISAVAEYQYVTVAESLLGRQATLLALELDSAKASYSAGTVSLADYRTFLTETHSVRRRQKELAESQQSRLIQVRALLHDPSFSERIIAELSLPAGNNQVDMNQFAAGRHSEIRELEFEVQKLKANLEMTQLQTRTDRNAAAGNRISPSIESALTGSREALLKYQAATEKLEFRKKQITVEFTTALGRLHEAQRRCDLCQTVLIPNAAEIYTNKQYEYTNSRLTIGKMLEAKRILLEQHMEYARAKADRTISFSEIQMMISATTNQK